MLLRMGHGGPFCFVKFLDIGEKIRIILDNSGKSSHLKMISFQLLALRILSDLQLREPRRALGYMLLTR